MRSKEDGVQSGSLLSSSDCPAAHLCGVPKFRIPSFLDSTGKAIIAPCSPAYNSFVLYPKGNVRGKKDGYYFNILLFNIAGPFSWCF